MSDMTIVTSQDREDERRQAILDGAHACFLQYGFAKTSLDDIAQRAGISRPLIYRKFKNKEDILAALYDVKLDGALSAGRDGAGRAAAASARRCCGCGTSCCSSHGRS